MKHYEHNTFETKDQFESKKKKMGVVSILRGIRSPFIPDQKLMRNLIKSIANFSAILNDIPYLEDGGKAMT
jgi:hypothetical protein